MENLMPPEDPPVTPPEPPAPPVTPPEPVQPPVEPPATPPADEAWKDQAERRKRQNDTLQAEIDELRRGQMDDQEKAVADAKAEGRTEALAESAKVLAGAQLRTAAAEAGVPLGELVDFIDVGKFVGDDGAVDSEAITAAVAKFATAMPKPGTAQPTPGAQGGATPPGQLTQAELKTMTPDAIVTAKAAGQLNTLLGIK